MVQQRSRAARSAPPAACRRTERGWRTSTAAIIRPATQLCSPARTVSTSGSSGTSSASVGPAVAPADGPPGRLGGQLLGFLLAAAGGGGEQPVPRLHRQQQEG